MLDKTWAFLQWVAGVEGVNVASSGGLLTEASDEVQRLRSLPKVVMLAGSSRFRQAFEDEAFRLALSGVIVLGKHVFKPGNDWPLGANHKDLIHAMQFRMLDLASELRVINVDAYVGSDTYNLIKYAIRTDKPVSFLEGKVKLLQHGADSVTTHHFMQATRQTVKFEQARID